MPARVHSSRPVDMSRQFRRGRARSPVDRLDARSQHGRSPFDIVVRSFLMRLQYSKTFTMSLFLVACGHAVATGASPDGCQYPPGLRDEISRKYPGTRLITLEDLQDDDRGFFQKDHGTRCPGLVRVNFYGDGKPTWALVLTTGKSSRQNAQLVVAHKVAKGWETRSLEATTGAPVVWRQPPGIYDDVYGEKKIRAKYPVIVFCGYESWAILYAWTGKDVKKIWLMD